MKKQTNKENKRTGGSWGDILPSFLQNSLEKNYNKQ